LKLIFKIAFRNILRHKGKSLVIGVILFLGSLLMTLGNGIISGMDRGIEKNIIEGFMGNAVLIPSKHSSDNVLLDMGGGTLETITTYRQLKPILESQDYITGFLPVGKNMAFALNNDEDVAPGFAYILGVDFEKYQKIFPDNIKVVEGRLPQKNERFALVPINARKEFYDFNHIWLLPEGGSLIKENMHNAAQKEDPGSIKLSSSVVLMGFSDTNSSTDIRFGVKSIVRFRSLNLIFGHFTLCDIESYRECLGYIVYDSVAVPEEKQKLLSMGDMDIESMFTENSLLVDNKKNITKKWPAPRKTVTPKPPETEFGSYNMVFVKFKAGISEKSALSRLNKAVSDPALGVRAVSWHKAAGIIGGMALLIKGALFVFVTLLFIVAVIIIINTLTMAALERTSEIGMMRAIGAKKGFIGLMFFGETGILSVVFGGAGIILGVIVVNIIPTLNISSSNDLLQLLYGGDVFTPVLQLTDIILTVFQLAFVTFIASAYPVAVARGITPLDAISRD
jgi:putative ABC transport system permease protein